MIFQDPSDIPSLNYSITGFEALIFGLIITALHKRALHQARTIVLADKARYDQVWASVLRDGEQRRAVDKLKELVDGLLLRMDARSVVRQYNRCASSGPQAQLLQSVGSFGSFQVDGAQPLPSLRISRSSSPDHSLRTPTPEWCALLDCGVPDMLDVQRPVDSLDQLYFQAEALNPILIRKVQGWALASGGCFCLRPTAPAPSSAHDWMERFRWSRGEARLDAVDVSFVARQLPRVTLATSSAVELLEAPKHASSAPGGAGTLDTVVIDRDIATEVQPGSTKDPGTLILRTEHDSNSLKSTASTASLASHNPGGATLSPPEQNDENCKASKVSAIPSVQDGSTEPPPVQPRSFHVRWEDVREEEAQGKELIKWGSIKSVQRALEKSTRSYGKVPSRLIIAVYWSSLANMNGWRTGNLRAEIRIDSAVC